MGSQWDYVAHWQLLPVKVKAITEWPVSTKVKEVQLFLGLMNYYRQFIKDFSKVAQSLNKLTRKDYVWKWGSEEQKAFDELKRRFVDKPILAMVDTTQPMRIETDASDFATGAYCLCYVMMKNGTLVLIYPKDLMTLNEITMCMTKRCLALCKH